MFVKVDMVYHVGTILLPGSSSEIPFALKSNAESRSPIAVLHFASKRFRETVQVRRVGINFDTHLQCVVWGACERVLVRCRSMSTKEAAMACRETLR